MPSEDAITVGFLQRLLTDAVQGLSTLESSVVTMTFGLVDGRPKTAIEIAKVYGVTWEEVKRIRTSAMDKLRDRDVSIALIDFLGLERFPLFGDALRRETDYVLVACPKHGWADEPHVVEGTCPCCPCPVQRSDRPGQPRKYCSSACRQLAYRIRTKTASSL